MVTFLAWGALHGFDRLRGVLFFAGGTWAYYLMPDHAQDDRLRPFTGLTWPG